MENDKSDDESDKPDKPDKIVLTGQAAEILWTRDNENFPRKPKKKRARGGKLGKTQKN